MYKLVHGTLYNIIEIPTPNQIAIVTTTAYSVQGYDSDVAIDIDTIPDKNEPPGQIGELHYISGVLQWVYVNKPLTVQEQLAQTIETMNQMSAENQNFMDYYFSKNPEPPVV